MLNPSGIKMYLNKAIKQVVTCDMSILTLVFSTEMFTFCPEMEQKYLVNLTRNTYGTYLHNGISTTPDCTFGYFWVFSYLQ